MHTQQLSCSLVSMHTTKLSRKEGNLHIEALQKHSFKPMTWCELVPYIFKCQTAKRELVVKKGAQQVSI